MKQTPIPGVLELGVLPPVWNSDWSPLSGRRVRGPSSHGDSRIVAFLRWMGWKYHGRHWRESQRGPSAQQWHVDSKTAAMVMMVACTDSSRGTQFRRGTASGISVGEMSGRATVFTSKPFRVYLVDGSVLHRAPKPISKEGPRHLVRYVLNGTVPQLLQELEDRRRSGSHGCVPKNLSFLFVGQVPLQLSFAFRIGKGCEDEESRPTSDRKGPEDSTG